MRSPNKLDAGLHGDGEAASPENSRRAAVVTTSFGRMGLKSRYPHAWGTPPARWASQTTAEAVSPGPIRNTLNRGGHRQIPGSREIINSQITTNWTWVGYLISLESRAYTRAQCRTRCPLVRHHSLQTWHQVQPTQTWAQGCWHMKCMAASPILDV